MNVTCERCEADIDPALDKNCFTLDPWGGNPETVCDACQERAYQRRMEHLMETT